MTFAEYWKENEPYGCNPEEVAELAWKAAARQCALIAFAEEADCMSYENTNGAAAAGLIGLRICVAFDIDAPSPQAPNVTANVR